MKSAKDPSRLPKAVPWRRFVVIGFSLLTTFGMARDSDAASFKSLVEGEHRLETHAPVARRLPLGPALFRRDGS